jgi:RHS repeat-associated protein
MENAKRVTRLPEHLSKQTHEEPPNPARDVQEFVGKVMLQVFKPMDMANLALAKATQWLSDLLPSFPAVRCYRDFTLGWPHSHPHPPTFGFPLPSIGPVLLAGATNVLINGFPAARSGDVGFGVWCGGYYPLFEVFTGSSNVFIGGARPARQFIDFTKHCLPGIPGMKGVEAARKGLSKVDKLMMGFTGVMGALGMGAALTDMANYQEEADSAESESDAKEAEAKAHAAGIEAAMAGIQAAADIAAMALSVGMGKDPGVTPFTCWGNFIMGSPNVHIGGFPMPGWMSILRGLGKLLKRAARKIQLRLPKGSRRRKALCLITGHPVDIATGRVFTSQTDFELPGRIPIDFTRTYDSSATDYEGPLGRGWMHPYDIHLWEDEGQGMVSLRNREGLLAGFDLLAVGEKVFNPLEMQWLERPEEKLYVVRGKDGVRYKFASSEDTATGGVDNPDGKSEAAAFKLTEIEDRNGNSIKLFYKHGRLSSLEDDAGTRLNFSYITLDNGAVRLAGVNQSLDQDSARTAKLINFTYDSEGRLTNATDRGLVPWRYAYDHYLLIRETNRNGLSFHFEYRGEGSEAHCVHTWGDGGIYERWLDYDHEGKMTIVENSLGARTVYYFNELDLPVRIVDALGGERRFSYGSSGELLLETDQIGRETRYLFNAQFDCLSITHPDGTMRRSAYNSDSLLEKLTDETGAVFRREYDEKGNLIAAVDALGYRREYSYNQFGYLESSLDPRGGLTKFKWDERGRLIEFSTPGGATTRCSYDERGRLVRVSDPIGNGTRYAYDASDRLVLVERGDGTKYYYEYDPEGNLTRYRDANGGETVYRYAGYNKLSERIDPSSQVRRLLYDTEARPIELRNEQGKANKFIYDALNRVIREIEFDGLEWKYDYDQTDQVIVRTDPAGRTTRLTWDLRGRVVKRERPDGTVIDFSYDSIGQLIEAEGPGSKLEFKYDVLGQVIWESQNGRVIEHEYDELGRRSMRRSPLNQTVEFAYDSDSQLSILNTPRGSMEFEYDKVGQITERRSPGDLEESFYYDQCGRIIEQSLHKPDRLLFHRGYKYDAKGNLIQLRDNNKGVKRFAYDPLERLREVLQPENEVEAFIYDSTGNLLRRGAREFRYDQYDHLTQIGDTTLIYDQVGNLIEKRRTGKIIRYSYDTDNQLTAVESDEGGRIEFGYDPLGRRIVKKSDGGEVCFLWDGDVLLSEERADWSAEYVFRSDGYEPICRFAASSFETYHNDHLGTPLELTNEEGRIVWSAHYDVYGRINKQEVNESSNQLRFQGQYEDAETGLYYNYFRYYDSDIGRYLSKDPLGLAGGINTYAYTMSPVNWIDPLGLEDYNDQVKAINEEISSTVNRKAKAVDRWMRMNAGRQGNDTISRAARLYNQMYQSENPRDQNFAKLIRGRFIDRMMHSYFVRRFGNTKGARMDQALPGSKDTSLRPDLYLPNVGGKSVIFDVGGPSKKADIEKYRGMADHLIPIIPEEC